MFKQITIVLISLNCVIAGSVNFENHIQQILIDSQRKLNPILNKLVTNNEISVDCSLSLDFVLKNAVQFKTWAIESKSTRLN